MLIIENILKSQRFFDFHDKKRNHLKSHDWMKKYQIIFYFNNSKFINDCNRVIFYTQYFFDVIVNWFDNLFVFVIIKWVDWNEFVRRFFMRFDELNWKQTRWLRSTLSINMKFIIKSTIIAFAFKKYTKTSRKI